MVKRKVQDHRPRLPRSVEASAERGLVPAVGSEMTGPGGLLVWPARLLKARTRGSGYTRSCPGYAELVFNLTPYPACNESCTVGNLEV
jgi:hypothetical protein